MKKKRETQTLLHMKTNHRVKILILTQDVYTVVELTQTRKALQETLYNSSDCSSSGTIFLGTHCVPVYSKLTIAHQNWHRIETYRNVKDILLYAQPIW